jgi:phenylacetyl-CoA:acceptor oxidoreductase subunit 2
MRGAEPQRQTYWDWRAAGNFIGGGAGTGLLFFTAIAAQHDPVWLKGELLALLLIAAGLGCVGLELGRPLRGVNVFFRPNTSWMSREAITAIALFPIAFASVVLNLSALGLVAAALGLFFLYCQSRILNAAKGIPAWREPAIVNLIVATGLTEGASLFVIVAALASHRVGWAVATMGLLIVVRLLVWLIYCNRLTRPGAAPKGTAEVLNRLRSPLAVAGHVLPFAILLIPLFLPRGGNLPVVVAALLALGGGWYLKFAIITRAAYDQGFAILRVPARTPGYSRTGVKPGWG